jgi:hypothetical protein
VITTLRVAFVQGRLMMDEFDARVGHTLTARTYGDLAAITADLPAGLAATEPRSKARPVRVTLPGGKAGTWAAGGAIPLLILSAGFFTYNDLFLALFFLPLVTGLGLWVLVAFARLLEAWDLAHSRTQGLEGKRDSWIGVT